MDSGLGELLHQRLYDLITREFHIKYRTAFVDAADGELAASLVGLLL